MKKMVLMISAFCFLGFMGPGLAQNDTDSGGQNMTELKQDNWTNTSDVQMVSAGEEWGQVGFFIGEAVKFISPKTDWKLKQIGVLGWNRYNETTQAVPPAFNFLIEVRDEKLNLLYRLVDTQNAYFTNKVPVLRRIDIPALSVPDSFYIIFYDRGFMEIGAEIEKGTGNSYFFDSRNNIMDPAGYRIEGSNATTLNWIIRAVGE